MTEASTCTSVILSLSYCTKMEVAYDYGEFLVLILDIVDLYVCMRYMNSFVQFAVSLFTCIFGSCLKYVAGHRP